MNTRRIWTAMLAAVVLLGACGIGRAAEDVVARFGGTTPGTAGGHACTTVNVTLLSNGKAARIPVPNDDTVKTGPPMPKKELDDAIKKLTPGQIVKISIVQNKDLGMAVDTIEAYDVKPGEDTPNGYVFSKSFDRAVGKNSVTTVVLTKFGAEHDFTVATRKGEKGEQEPDPDVMATLGKLQENSAVWVQTQGKSILTAIEPYTEPLVGKVTKIADADIDGHKVKSAEIDADGKTITVLVPGKESAKTFVADTVIAAQLSKVKVGSQVEFRTRADGDKTWLREIEAQKPTPKKPAEKMDAPAKK